MIVNAQIKKFVTCSQYADKSFEALFKEAGVGYKKITTPKLGITKLD
jgi:deoxycytidylate deaminase